MAYGAGLIGILLLEILVRANTYYLTDDRIISEYKFLWKNQTSVPYEKITDISPSSTIINRIFRSGTVNIQTAGADATEVSLNNIKHPEKITTFISEKIRQKKDSNDNLKNTSKSALDKLKDRLAEGEISEKEFKRKKELLEE